MIVNTRASAYLIALVLMLATPALLRAAQSTSLELLLNQANQMNNQEEDMASDLKSKAGDNQALITMAETIKEDHKANQSALESLASQKSHSL
jgi:hypothetical protein